MRVREIKHYHPHGIWAADWSQSGCCDYSDVDDVVETHQPMLQMRLANVLNEVTYRDLMQDPRLGTNFLDQNRRVGRSRFNNAYNLGPTTVWGRSRSEAEQRKNYYFGGISYQKFSGDTMIFYVTPSTEEEDRNKDPFYMCEVKFLGWDETASDPDMTLREKVSSLLWDSDIQLHCTDPSFKYWGFQYILTKMMGDPPAAIYAQDIPPNTNNPHRQGIVCKHLNRVLRVVPFYFNDISYAISRQWGGQLDPQAVQSIDERARIQREVNAGVNLPSEQELPDQTDQQMQMPIPPDQETPGMTDETPPTA